MNQHVDGWPRRGANGGAENRFGGKEKLGRYGGRSEARAGALAL
jgi:hypothetical protein